MRGILQKFQQNAIGLFLVLLAISWNGGNLKGQTQESDFMLERLRFNQNLGYWMNDNLYSFAVLRTAQAESYEQNDLKQYARRIHQQGHIIDTQGQQIERFQTKVMNYEQIVKGQNELIDKSIERADKERRKRIRAKRAYLVTIVGAFVGGVYVAK